VFAIAPCPARIAVWTWEKADWLKAVIDVLTLEENAIRTRAA
jgi:hypothetical protein